MFWDGNVCLLICEKAILIKKFFRIMLTVFFIEMSIQHVQETRSFVTVSPFCHTCASLLANKLDKASTTCSRLRYSLINSRNSPTLFIFLSIIVFSSEATSLIANRKPSLYNSSIFNFLILYALAHLSQYFSTIIAPSVLYLTNLVAGFPHAIQNLEFFSGLM
jgi:hypothetical protein